LLAVTAKGRRVEAASVGTVEAAVRRVLARTPRRRLEQARRLLADLVEALDAG
jgi:hypothetical protein